MDKDRFKNVISNRIECSAVGVDSDLDVRSLSQMLCAVKTMTSGGVGMRVRVRNAEMSKMELSFVLR